MKLRTKIALSILTLLVLAFTYVIIAYRYENGRWLHKIRKDIKVYSSTILAEDDDFTFIFGDGSGWHGYEILKVSTPDLSVTYVYRKREEPKKIDGNTTHPWHWRKVKKQISKAQVDRLRAKLNYNSVFNLHASYHEGITDGHQQYIHLQRGTDIKHVYLDNYFPPEVRYIERHLTNLISELDLKNPNLPHEKISREEFQIRRMKSTDNPFIP